VWSEQRLSASAQASCAPPLQSLRHWRIEHEMWAPDEIQFDDIDHDATDHPVVTVRIGTPVALWS